MSKTKKDVFFENGSDTVRMDDMKMVTDFSLKIDKLESAFLVHIPAYNIHFYTTKEDEKNRARTNR